MAHQRFSIPFPLVAALAVLLSRLVLIFVLAWVTGGREFSDDVGMHYDMAARPLQLLVGQTASHGQHPPLLPVLEWALLAPLRSLFGDFVAIRVGFALAEAVLAGILVGVFTSTRTRRLTAVGLLLSPMLWMSSSVMPQDEIIAAAMLAGVLALVKRNKLRTALLLCGVGAAAAKIFLVMPLLALVVALSRPPAWQRVALGFGPPVLILGLTGAAALAGGQPLPLSGFTPHASFGVNAWTFVLDDISVASAKWISAILAAILGALPLGLAWLRDKTGAATPWPVLLAAMFAWAFLAFYHVNPEYLLLVLVPLAFVVTTAKGHAWLHAAMALPWAANFFYGVATAKRTGVEGGKEVFVALYDRVTDLPPERLQQVAVLGTTAILAGVAVRLTLQLWWGHRDWRGSPVRPRDETNYSTSPS